MKYSSLYLLVGASLSGCAGSPILVNAMSDSQLHKTPWVQLCNAYAVGNHHSEKIAQELKARDRELAELIAAGKPDPITGDKAREPFTDREWQAMNQGKIYIGMSEPALICTWGLPSTFTGGDIHRAVSASGERRQYVYRDSLYASANYVYIEDGRVVSYQD